MPKPPLPLDELLTEAISRAAGPERDAWIAGACRGNGVLEQELRELLEAHETAASFLEAPLFPMPTIDVTPGGDPTGSPRPGADEEPVLSAEGPAPHIGRYKLLQRLGEGGFGVVYMAEQERPVRRKVALKVIKLGMDTKQVIGRFEAERQALALMDHPNIARVLDAGATEAGRPYFVMELVKGEPITDYCDRHTLSTRERLELFVDVCRAVQHAHQKGVIHRDLKPSNVMVTMHDGVPVPKVIDFGIAKATNARLTERTVFTEYQQFIGTPEYMSPEQAEMSGLDIDTRSDVYALGVLLYELLTGTTPFDAKALREAGYVELQRIIREDEPDRPSTRLSTLGALLLDTAQRRDTDAGSLARALRGDLDWIVMRCLEKDRTRRYEMASDLAADIERHLNDEPVLAGAPSATYRMRKFVRRNRVLVTTGAVIAATLVVATIVSAAATIIAVRSALEAGASREESEAVTDFLSGMLASVKPERLGREVLVTDVLDDASERVGRDFAEKPLVEAKLRRVIADSFVALGKYQEAEPHAMRDEEICRRELGRDHPETLQAGGALGRVLTRTGQYGKADTVLTETLERCRDVLGADHAETLRAMHDLGSLYVIAGRYEEAKTLLIDALDGRRRVLGPEDTSTLVSMHNLASFHLRTGGLEEGLALHEEALPIQRRVLGDEHRHTLATMLSLSSLYGWRGDLARAERLLEETLPAHRKVLGEEHMQTLQVMGNLAVLYQMGEKYDLAEPLHRQILATRRETLGDMHHDTLQSRLGLADLCRRTGRYAEAEKLVLEVLDGEHELEETSVLMLRATSDLARLLVLREPQSEREPARALALVERACSLAAPDAELLDALAFVRFQTGDVAGAVQAQRQAVELSPGDAALQASLEGYEAALGAPSPRGPGAIR